MSLALSTLILIIGMSSLIGYTVYRREQIPDPLVNKILDRTNEMMNRLVLMLVVAMLLFLNLITASAALSDEKAEALNSLLTIGPVEIGAHTAIMLLMAAWMIAPMVTLTVGLIYRRWRDGDEVLDEEKWGETA